MRNIADINSLVKPTRLTSYMTIGRYVGEDPHYVHFKKLAGICEGAVLESGATLIGYATTNKSKFETMFDNRELAHKINNGIYVGLTFTHDPAQYTENPDSGTHKDVGTSSDTDIITSQVEGMLATQVGMIREPKKVLAEYNRRIAHYAKNGIPIPSGEWDNLRPALLQELLASAIVQTEYENAAIFRDLLKQHEQTNANLKAQPLLPYNGPDSTRNNG